MADNTTYDTEYVTPVPDEAAYYQDQDPNDSEDVFDLTSGASTGGGGALSSYGMTQGFANAKALREQAEKEYGAVQKQQQLRANAIRDTLQRARATLAGDHPSKRAMWFAISAALGTPTKTGSFGETIGNAAGAAATSAREQEQERVRREHELMQIDQQLAGYGTEPDAIDADVLKSRLGLAQLKLTQAGQEDVAAIRSGARGAAGDAFTNALRAAGIDPNSPEGQALARQRVNKLATPPRDPNAPVALTEADHRLAQRASNYEIDPATLLSRSSGEKRQALLDDIYNYNNNWNPANYKPFTQALAQYGSNKNTDPGGQVRAFGTASEHLVTVMKLADALGGGNVRLFNQIRKAAKDQFGGKEPVDLASAVALVAPELQAAMIAGSGGGIEERQAIQALIDGSRNPQVVHSQINQVLLPMMGAKIRNLRSGFYANVPEELHDKYKGWFERHVPSHQRRILQDLGIDGDWNVDGDIQAVAPADTSVAPAAPHAGLSADAQRYLKDTQ